MQTTKGENGPTKADGQREHHHGHGQGKEAVRRVQISSDCNVLCFLQIPTCPKQTQNTVYEIVSDMSGRQDAVDERLSSLEDKMQAMQVRELKLQMWNILIAFFLCLKDRLEALPEIIARCLTQHQERVDQRRNFLHPDTAAASSSLLPTPIPTTPSPLIIPHSRYASSSG